MTKAKEELLEKEDLNKDGLVKGSFVSPKDHARIMRKKLQENGKKKK